MDAGAPNSGQKKAVRKGGQKTVERLWQQLKVHPHLSQAGLVAALGITRSTVQKHIENLKRAGRLRRIGPDKGGHWEVVKMKSGNNAVLIYQDDNGVSSVKAVREPTVHGGEPTDGDNLATSTPREA